MKQYKIFVKKGEYMKFNTFYGTHNTVIREETEPSMTDQQYKESCDINFIVNQYVKQGIPIPQSPVSYADLTSVEDYENSLMVVSQYKTAFELLPAEDRERFDGKVENYLAFICDSNNLRESYEKGYIDPSSVTEEMVYPERFQTTQTVPGSVTEPTPVTTPTVSE